MGNKGESAESGEKKKKRVLLPIIIVASVLVLGGAAGLLAGLGVFKGQEPTESEESTEVESSTEEADDYSDVKIWWNVDRSKYAGQSDIGTSSRTPDKDDGYYHVLFAQDGRQVTRRVAEKKILNVVDGNDIMGLRFDEKGIISEVLRIEEFTGGFEIQGWYVSAVDAENNIVTVNSAANLGGMDEEYEIPKSAAIYDVSGNVNYVGMPISFDQLQEKDRIFAIRNLEGEVFCVFVTDRYVQPQIYWNVSRQYDKELLATTRMPNADGEYEILMAHNGEQVVVKTKERKIATAIDKQAAKCVSLTFDSDGYCVKVQGASGATGGSFASWYHIQSLENGHIVAKKISKASDTGKIQEGDLADDYRAFYVGSNAEFVGIEVFDLKAGDQIHALKDQSGKIFIVFIISRQSPSEVYWNTSRKYDSTNKVTTRTKEADGYYHFKLACNGKVADYKTKDKAIATKVDSYAAKCFGLQLSGNIILGTYSAASCTGGSSFASWYDVTKINGKEITCKKDPNSTASDAGTVVTGTLSSEVKIFNVSSYTSKYVGEYTSLKVGDKVHCLTDFRGEVKVVFVVTRKVPSTVAYCPICDKEVTYAAATSLSTAQTDSTGAYLETTHFYLPQDITLSAQGSTCYRSEKVGTSTKYYKTSNVHLNLMGKTLTAAEDTRLLAQFGEGAELYVFDTAEKKGTLKASAGRANDRGSVFWTMSEKSKLVVSDITIDLSAVNQPTATGVFYNDKSTSTWEFNNVTIIGPKNTNSAGSVLMTSGTLTLNDTTIIGGKSEELGSIYLTAETAKLYINGKTSITGGTLADGTTKANVYLAKGALIYTTDGITSEDGSIGITTASEGVFTSTGFTGLKDKFVSDITGGEITEENGKLSIKYVIDGLKYDETSASVEIGEAKKIVAHTTPAASSSVVITYVSSDPESVQVNSDGTIIGVKETSTPVTITASVDTGEKVYEATIQVTVTAATKALDHYHAEATSEDITAGKGAKVNYTAWNDSTKIPTTSGYYYLTTDIQLTGQNSMAEGVVLHLCLNGHKITGGENTSRAISIHNKNCELDVCDCSEGETGAIYAPLGTENQATQGRAVWVRYGVFNLYGGTLVGSTTTYAGGTTSAMGGATVYVASGATMNMYGGTLKDGVAFDTSTTTSVNCGGGNLSVSGTVNMYGGTIENGIGGHGGNVYIKVGTMNMYGGTIKGGYAGYEKDAQSEIVLRTITDASTGKAVTWRCGGNVYVYSNAASKFNMYGGTIEDGKALGAGGNIFCGSNNGVNICGEDKEKTIVQNGYSAKSYGGNIASDTNYAYTIENATFNGGTAYSRGASIYAQGPAVTLKNVTVNGGTTSNVGQVYIGNGVATIENCTITSATLTDDTLEAYCASLAIVNVKGVPSVTIKDSTIDAIYITSISALTLDGKMTVGTAEKAGLIITDTTLGDKISLAETFSTESMIYVTSTVGGATVASNGADQIANFTQLLGEDYELAADETKLVLRSVDFGKHKHCDCGTDDYKATTHTCSAQVWTEWTSTNSLPISSGYYYLGVDVTVATTCRFGSDQDIHLCLNGHKITTTAARALTSYTGTAYSSKNPTTTGDKGGTSYTLTDCAKTAGSFVTTKTANGNTGGVIWVKNNSEMKGNTINIYRITLGAEEGAHVASNKGDIFSVAGNTVVNQYSGTIQDGQSKETTSGKSACAGNVYVYGNAVWNMYGGEIKNGKCISEAGFASGGNVYIGTTATFNLYGGKISGGTANGTTTGSANVGVVGTFNMYGGTIDGTSAAKNDGALWGDSASKLTINAGTIVGGVYSKSADAAAVTLNGSPEIDSIHLNDAKITLGETFAARTGAPIAISMKTAGVFTTNEGAVEDFKSVDTTLHVEKNLDKTLSLVAGEIAEVTLSETTLSLYIGNETAELVATPNTLAENFTSISWTSSDTTKATVGIKGVDPLTATVTRVAEGDVTITVTLKVGGEDVKAECAVTCMGDTYHKHCVCGGCFTDGQELTETLKHTCADVEWTPWTSETMLPKYDDLKVGDNYFYLTKDVQLNATWFCSQKEDSSKVTDMEGRNVIICLNGHTVKNKSGARFSSGLQATSPSTVYTANLNITFTDCQETPGTVKLSGSTGTNQGVFLLSVGENTVLNIYNITIDGSELTNKITSCGGLISLSGKNAIFNLYSGTITGGSIKGTPTKAPAKNYHYTTSGNGGNVYILKGTMNMYGGTIQNGTAYYGGGNVTIGTSGTDFATLNMYGGEIKDGKVGLEEYGLTNGGNLMVRGNFNMYGGKISGGLAKENKSSSANTTHAGYTSQGYGGNVFIGGGVTNIYGGEISGGQATFGGNLCVKIADSAVPTAVVNITGGKISGGKAYSGAAIRIMQGYSNATSIDVTIGGTAEITDNATSSSSGFGPGIYTSWGNLTITGTAKFSGNTTGSKQTDFDGDDIYLLSTSNMTKTSINFVEYEGTGVIYIGNGGSDGKNPVTGMQIATVDADYSAVLKPARPAFSLVKDGTALSYVQK